MATHVLKNPSVRWYHWDPKKHIRHYESYSKCCCIFLSFPKLYCIFLLGSAGSCPQNVLYSELSTGSKTRSHPMLRSKGVAKQDLVAFSIDTSAWEEPTGDSMETRTEKRRWKHRNQMARKFWQKEESDSSTLFSDFCDSVMLHAS